MADRSTAERRHLQRVPPHDLSVERDLLGAALISRQAAIVVATELEPEDFYAPQHARLAGALRELVAAEDPSDVGTVSAHLRAHGGLDDMGTVDHKAGAYLVHLMAECPATTSAPKWAGLVRDMSRKRRMLHLAGEVVESVYSGRDAAGLVAEMHAEAADQAAAASSSWEPVNLAQVLAGDEGRVEPTLLRRSDGACLLYPGKVHAFNAESESGKSWLALLAAAEQLAAGAHVLYLDFEDAPAGIVDRLLGLGVPANAILELFHYVRPDDAIDAGARLRIAEMARVWPLALAVIDGVAEALALSGWDENSASDVTRFFVSLPRPLARAGAAVILIDHVVKDRDRQGNDARGSGAKRAGIDGATYKLEVLAPFGRGLQGKARISVTKDRPGFVRARCAGGKTVGELTLAPSATGGVRALVTGSRGADEPFRPTGYMERVSRELEQNGAMSLRQIRSVIRGKAGVIDTALSLLISEGYATRMPGARGAWMHSSVKPFREAPDPVEEPVDNYDEEPF